MCKYANAVAFCRFIAFGFCDSFLLFTLDFSEYLIGYLLKGGQLMLLRLL